MKPWHEAREAPGRWGGGSYYGERDRQEPAGFPAPEVIPGKAHRDFPPHAGTLSIPPEAWRGRPDIGDVSGLGTGWGAGTGNVELGEHWDEPSER